MDQDGWKNFRKINFLYTKSIPVSFISPVFLGLITKARSRYIKIYRGQVEGADITQFQENRGKNT